MDIDMVMVEMFGLVMVIVDHLGATMVQLLVDRRMMRGSVNIINVALRAIVLPCKVEIIAILNVKLILILSTDVTEPF